MDAAHDAASRLAWHAFVVLCAGGHRGRRRRVAHAAADPDFDPTPRAICLVGVLENPSCRRSTGEAVRAGVEPRPDLPATLLARA